ncbi:MAG TPA: PepSY-associated TM helix domain-containing protein, partial [Elusimicrobiota bacterium]|nr:PepSY-associated TM helix domain-containing protein [Elusimicrobiota bacterium]
MKPRRVLFWLHLAAGATAGSVVLIMAGTGVLLAAQTPVLAFAERSLRVAPPSPGAPRLDLDALVERARAAAPGAEPDGALLHSDPSAPVAVSFGRERTVFLNPYDGSVLGEGASGLRRFFQRTEEWHRWLAASGNRRPAGRAVTGACNAAFFFLALSGPFLWWPRRWTRTALRASLLPSLKGRGKARDWNWHNAVG